ncbi:MAG TPA: hypothetical protein ENJ80_10245 [Gammaproteobacteria bacterium]|nr:hypothetical protein [Gammaproteobacteria bacterium]
MSKTDELLKTLYNNLVSLVGEGLKGLETMDPDLKKTIGNRLVSNQDGIRLTIDMVPLSIKADLVVDGGDEVVRLFSVEPTSDNVVQFVH